MPIRYTQTLFATRRWLLVTRRTPLVTRIRLFVTRLNKGNFKEIHILKRPFLANVLFLHKNVCLVIALNTKSSRLTLSKLDGKCGTPEGTRYIMVSPPSSRRRSTARRAVEFNCSSPYGNQKRETPDGVSLFWYAGRDSNPRPTDS